MTRAQLLDAEKSSELVAAFRLLADASDKGQPRFPAAACRAVERAIASRNYASALLELCHLTRAAGARRGGYLELFWAPGPMHTGRLRDLFAGCRSEPGGWLRVDAAGVELVYPDGRFGVAYGRMPFLVAMAEFLVTALGYAALDDLLRPLAGKSLTRADVSRLSNALSRAVYDYLKQHLPPLQLQRKLNAVVEHLCARNGGDFDGATIDDAAVAEFWRAAMDDETAEDFRTFSSVFLAFARLRQVLECAETIGAVEQALPIGASLDDGEVDPADVSALVDMAADEDNPLDGLEAAPCSRIKFFTGKERDRVKFLFECGRAADALPLSFARCEVFGPVQGRISQSLRLSARADAVRRLIAEGPAETYRGHQEALRDTAAQGRTVLLAAVHVLQRAGLQRFEDVVRLLGPGLEADLREPATVVAFPAAGGGRRRGAAAAQPPSTLDGLLVEARQAAKGITRQGFRPDEIGDADVKDGFLAGCPLVVRVVERVESFADRLAKLRPPAGDWDAQLTEDRAFFEGCFLKLYGAAV